MISCGSSIGCITESGHCFVWGNNPKLSLELQSWYKSTYEPFAIVDIPNETIKTIKCGSIDCMFFLTYSGKIYQLKNGSCKLLDCKEFIVNFTVGSDPQIIFTNNKNQFYEFACDYARLDHTPREIISTQYINITKLYSYIIYETGSHEFHIAGDNYYGQLTRGYKSSYSTIPMCINTPQRFIFITAGSFHLFGLTKEGKCYGWGYNLFGQLGLGNFVDQTTPTLLRSFEDENETIKTISCGYWHSVFLTESQKLYVCGRIDAIELGNYRAISQNDSYPTLLKLPSFERSALIVCGNHNTIVIDVELNVWICGDNQFNQLNQQTDTQNNGWNLVPLHLPANEMVKTSHITWTIRNHKYASTNTKSIILLLLWITQRTPDGIRKHKDVLISLLNRDIIICICEYLPLYSRKKSP